MRPEDVPQDLMDALSDHDPYEAAGGYEACWCGYGHGGPEEDYNAHILAIVLPLFREKMYNNLRNDGMNQFDHVPHWALKQIRGENET